MHLISTHAVTLTGDAGHLYNSETRALNYPICSRNPIYDTIDQRVTRKQRRNNAVAAQHHYRCLTNSKATVRAQKNNTQQVQQRTDVRCVRPVNVARRVATETPPTMRVVGQHNCQPDEGPRWVTGPLQTRIDTEQTKNSRSALRLVRATANLV